MPVLFLVLTARWSMAGTLAQFRTFYGDLEVELYDQQKPVTVQNFKRLVQSGAYWNTFFHRLEPGFVVQGGGFAVLPRYSTNFFFPDWPNLVSVPNFGSISNEFKVGPLLSNTKGTIAMAKTSNPDSANSQFFFNLADNSGPLDSTNNSGGFTVFGHVLHDTGPTNYGGLLGLFNLVTYSNGLVNMTWWYPTNSYATNLFQTLPVTYFFPDQPWYSDLFYVDISLLSIQVTTTNHQPRISWDSARGMTNVVEYTTTMPPVWKTLCATNGNGSRLTVADSAATNGFRFYRVRVQ